MSTEDDDIRELDLGENPVKCEFCAATPCICEGEDDEDPEVNPSGKLVEAQKQFAAQGITIKHSVEWEEYIVKPKGEKDDCDISYHTDDLDDAISNAAVMAKWIAEHPQANPEEVETDDCECYDDCDCEENCTCGPCDKKACEEACSCCCDCTCEEEGEEPAE